MIHRDVVEYNSVFMQFIHRGRIMTTEITVSMLPFIPQDQVEQWTFLINSIDVKVTEAHTDEDCPFYKAELVNLEDAINKWPHLISSFGHVFTNPLLDEI